MERYNPFAQEPEQEEFTHSSTGTSSKLEASNVKHSSAASASDNAHQTTTTTTSKTRATYSTSFPDPYELIPSSSVSPSAAVACESIAQQTSSVSKTNDTSVLNNDNNSFSLPKRQDSSDDDNDDEVSDDPSYIDSDDDTSANKQQATSLTQQQQSQQQHRPIPRATGRTNLSGTGTGGGSFRQSRQAGTGFGSFLSRTASVTSSSVVESVRGAMDSLSSQIQQANPLSGASGTVSGNAATAAAAAATITNSAAAHGITSTSAGGSMQSVSLAKLSSSSNQQLALISRQRVLLMLESSSNIDSMSSSACDWPSQFQQYRRHLNQQNHSQTSGTNAAAAAAGSAGPSSTFSSFFTGQFITSASSSSSLGQHNHQSQADIGGDLIEQASLDDISVLANQSSSTAAICLQINNNTITQNVQSSSVTGSSLLTTATNSLLSSPKMMMLSTSSNSNNQQQQQQQQTMKIIRPEFVVVRQRPNRVNSKAHLQGIVKAFEYCSVPMFEPYQVWSTFQDKQLIFAKLLSAQKALGKETFPLIPQVFCQTHQDLSNYINSNSQSITLPCLVRIGQFGARMRYDSLQMLRDFVSIMRSEQLSCTLEQYLDVKHELVVQKLGNNLKLFKRINTTNASGANSSPDDTDRITTTTSNQNDNRQQQQQTSTTSNTLITTTHQPTTRQTSLGGGVLSSLISSAGQQVSRRSSQPQGQIFGSSAAGSNTLGTTGTNNSQQQYERVQSEVSSRYRLWIETISEIFDYQIDMFQIKIIVATNDREYIVGLRNCSMQFYGNQENQDEDRRAFVELILNKMNTLLPKHSPIGRQKSNNSQSATFRRASGNNNNNEQNYDDVDDEQQRQQQTNTTKLYDKRLSNSGHMSTDGSCMSQQYKANATSSSMYNRHPNNRSKSVSINQGDQAGSSTSLSIASERLAGKGNSTNFGLTGGSSNRIYNLLDRRRDSDEQKMLNNDGTTSNAGNSPRQSSFGQSIYDQTSTALNSLGNKSMSILRRFDTAGISLTSSTPPQSARLPGDHYSSFGSMQSAGSISNPMDPIGLAHSVAEPQLTRSQRAANASLKSQSIDGSSMIGFGSPRSMPGSRRGLGGGGGGPPPPVPPPPSLQSSVNRQSSLASGSRQYSSGGGLSSRQNLNEAVTPHSTPIQSRQNTAASCESLGQSSSQVGSNQTTVGRQQTQRVVRQNSALSAFEPYDSSIIVDKLGNSQLSDQMRASFDGKQQSTDNKPLTDISAGAKRNSQTFDSTSIRSADSSGNTDVSGGEDTMNNLKITFANILRENRE